MNRALQAAVGLLWLSAAVAALAADSSGDDVSGLAAIYAKQATWQETIYATREAQIARDAAWLAEGKGTADGVPGVTFGPWSILTLKVPAGSPTSHEHLIQQPFPPEQGEVTGWKECPGLADDPKLNTAFPDKGSILYAQRTITAAAPLRVVLAIRHHRFTSIWLDGKRIFHHHNGNTFTGTDFNLQVTLTPGPHRLLVKIIDSNRLGFRCLGGAEVLANAPTAKSMTEDPRAVYASDMNSHRGDRRWPIPPNNPGLPIHWKDAPKPPFEHPLTPLWGRLARDHRGPMNRRQMAWERRDGIWDQPWPKGSVQELAQRYAKACKESALATEATRLAAQARSQADLQAVRAIYYTAQRLDELPPPEVHEAAELAVADLIATFGAKYAEGPAWLARLKALRGELAEAATAARSGAAAAWTAFDILSDEFSDLREKALLANPLLDFQRLLLVRRFAGYGVGHTDNGNEPGQGSNFMHQCGLPSVAWDNEIAVLSPVHPDGELRTLHRPGDKRFVGEVDLHWDAKRMLFTSADDQGRWQVFEIGSNGTGLRQVTREHPELPLVDNYDACYLPSGKVLFSSNATFQGVSCASGNRVGNLHVAEADGTGTRRLCYDQEHNWYPTVLNDGRVLFTRWEYADFSHLQGRIPLTMNPDGTNQRAIYKINSWFPVAMQMGTPIPGEENRLVFILSGHHGSRRRGYLAIVDPSRSQYETEGILHMMPPGRKGPIRGGKHDGYANERYPAFIHPQPLSAKYFLVACRPTLDQPFGIYLADVFDNLVLVRDDMEYGLYEPIPLRTRRMPPVIPDRVDPARKDADVYIGNIHHGPGLAGVPRGSVKSLRLYALNYGYPNLSGFGGKAGPFDKRRVLGTAPVEPDGSAYFRVPANTPISFQPLDAEGNALQLMRSWYTAMPGERISCMGCHERPADAAQAAHQAASTRPPSPLQPWRGPARGMGLKADLLPALQRHCFACHDQKDKSKPNLADYQTLRQYLHIPPNESGVELQIPGFWHADSSPLVQLIKKGHHGVAPDQELLDRLVTWLDLGAPLYSSWQEQQGRSPGKHYVEGRLTARRLYANSDEDWDTVIEPPSGPVEPLVSPKPAPAPAVTCPGWPFDTAEAQRRQKEAGPEISRSIKIGNTSVDLVLIPAGEFVMGDAEGPGDERTVHRVRIAKPFWMSKTEVSQGHWKAFQPHQANGTDWPMTTVSWQQAQNFCAWLSAKTGKRCRLPTEAEWEWACRAGSAGRWGNGIEAPKDFKPKAHWSTARGPVNAWGLVYMQGNVAEWTQSLYRPYPVVAGDGRDDPGDPGPRVIRGHHAGNPIAAHATASYRWRYQPWQCLDSVGFRVVIAADE
jgi:hypothetical protein